MSYHLLKYDTTHGIFNQNVDYTDNTLMINDNTILTFAERDPNKLPWNQLHVDVVLECTGLFTSKESAMAHITAGARKVIISAPGKNVDATIVYGVNDNILTSDMQVISNASCTTNCLAPVLLPLSQQIGIETGFMTTIHAYTNDQKLSDVFHSDLRRARAASMNMIPTKTGAAVAVGEVLPELKGKLDGGAVRVPTLNVSLVDLTFVSQKETTAEQINQFLFQAAKSEPLKKVLGYCELPLVSSDFNHSSLSSVFDATQTKVLNHKLVKVMAWYDNEWGFSNRMLDNAIALMKVM